MEISRDERNVLDGLYDRPLCVELKLLARYRDNWSIWNTVNFKETDYTCHQQKHDFKITHEESVTSNCKAGKNFVFKPLERFSRQGGS